MDTVCTPLGTGMMHPSWSGRGEHATDRTEGDPIQHHDGDLGPSLTQAVAALDAAAGAIVVGAHVIAATGPARHLTASTLRAAAEGGALPSSLTGCNVLRAPFPSPRSREDGLLLFRAHPFSEVEEAVAAALAQAADAVQACRSEHGCSVG